MGHHASRAATDRKHSQAKQAGKIKLKHLDSLFATGSKAEPNWPIVIFLIRARTHIF